MNFLNPEVETAIMETASIVNQVVADNEHVSLDAASRLGICRKMALNLFVTLSDFYDLDRLDIDTRMSWSGDTHSYPVILGETLDQPEVIVEGAWLQLVPENLHSHDLPLVLIGTRPHIVRAATRAGVWECDRQIWYPRSQFYDPRTAISRHPANRQKAA